MNGRCHDTKCFNNVASAEFNCPRFELISERSQSDSSAFCQSRNVSQKLLLWPKSYVPRGTVEFVADASDSSAINRNMLN